MADAWVSPTGFNDPTDHWLDEANIYDENLATYAHVTISGGWAVELLLDAPIECNKIRVCTLNSGFTIRVDVYYDGDWHNEFGEWTTTKDIWEEKTLIATKTVEKARIFSWHSALGIAEFDFSEIEPPATNVEIDVPLVAASGATLVPIFVSTTKNPTILPPLATGDGVALAPTITITFPRDVTLIVPLATTVDAAGLTPTFALGKIVRVLPGTIDVTELAVLWAGELRILFIIPALSRDLIISSALSNDLTIKSSTSTGLLIKDTTVER